MEWNKLKDGRDLYGGLSIIVAKPEGNPAGGAGRSGSPPARGSTADRLTQKVPRPIVILGPVFSRTVYIPQLPVGRVFVVV